MLNPNQKYKQLRRIKRGDKQNPKNSCPLNTFTYSLLIPKTYLTSLRIDFDNDGYRCFLGEKTDTILIFPARGNKYNKLKTDGDNITRVFRKTKTSYFCIIDKSILRELNVQPDTDGFLVYLHLLENCIEIKLFRDTITRRKTKYDY